MRLIEVLAQIQHREGLTDQQFADKLGLHRVSWSKIKCGRAPFGKKFLAAVRQSYPELKDNIDIFLSGEATDTSKLATVVNSNAHQTTQGLFLGALLEKVKVLVLRFRHFRVLNWR